MHGTPDEIRGCGIARNTHSIVGSTSRRSNRFLIGRPVDFYPFDGEYVRRLRAGDAEVQEHFSLYFAKSLLAKLRSDRHPAQDIEDVIQETLARALEKLHELRQAESLGAFVHGICKRVCWERGRTRQLESLPEESSEFLRSRDNQEKDFLEEERRRALRRAILSLDDKEQRLLTAYCKDISRGDLAKMLEVSPDYLRVCLHRAKKILKRRFLEKFDKKHKPKDKKTTPNDEKNQPNDDEKDH